MMYCRFLKNDSLVRWRGLRTLILEVIEYETTGTVPDYTYSQIWNVYSLTWSGCPRLMHVIVIVISCYINCSSFLWNMPSLRACLHEGGCP